MSFNSSISCGKCGSYYTGFHTCLSSSCSKCGQSIYGTIHTCPTPVNFASPSSLPLLQNGINSNDWYTTVRDDGWGSGTRTIYTVCKKTGQTWATGSCQQ